MVVLERVLYVEDDPDVQEIAALALSELGGLQVFVCSSGVEALDMFPRVRPQLVLLDVMMPGMDGLSMLGALRNLPGGKDVPVVFMTAKAQSHEVHRYQDLGTSGVITKPFDPMTLADQVRTIWAKASGGRTDG